MLSPEEGTLKKRPSTSPAPGRTCWFCIHLKGALLRSPPPTAVTLRPLAAWSSPHPRGGGGNLRRSYCGGVSLGGSQPHTKEPISEGPREGLFLKAKGRLPQIQGGRSWGPNGLSGLWTRWGPRRENSQGLPGAGEGESAGDSLLGWHLRGGGCRFQRRVGASALPGDGAYEPLVWRSLRCKGHEVPSIFWQALGPGYRRVKGKSEMATGSAATPAWVRTNAPWGRAASIYPYPLPASRSLACPREGRREPPTATLFQDPHSEQPH